MICRPFGALVLLKDLDPGVACFALTPGEPLSKETCSILPARYRERFRTWLRFEFMSLASRAQLSFEMRFFPQLALWAIYMPPASPTG
jgi:hypothetical protein